MIKGSIKIKHQNKYHFDVIDVRTGRIRQSVESRNVVCTGFYNPGGTSSIGLKGNKFCSSVLVGSGTGTPSESDTAITSKLWSITPDSQKGEVPQYNIAKYTIIATVPADTSHVGTITEVGVEGARDSYTYCLFSHSLLKDAEGNPISIEKTDIDKVIITITFTIEIEAVSPWKPVLNPYYCYAIRASELNDHFNSDAGVSDVWHRDQLTLLSTVYGAMFPHIDCTSYYNHPLSYPRYGQVVAAMTMTQASKKLAGSGRLAQSIGEDLPLYINAICVHPICYVMLPESTVFPSYDIKGITVGTGDGSTVSFMDPLNYFVKDSEKLYVDGAELVRNVDYTIDYRNNRQRLTDLGATAKAVITSGLETTDVYLIPFQRFSRAKEQNTWGSMQSYPIKSFYGWKAGTPMIIDLQGTEDFNTVYLPQWVTTQDITVSYSDDGTNWTDWQTWTHKSGTAETTTGETVSAKYIRISGTNTSFDTWIRDSLNIDREIYIGYMGQADIIFTTAPAANAVITMDVTMDRPFKNGNYVIDTSVELQL